MAKNEFSLVNVDSKAITKFIEVVSGALGRAYNPLDKILNAYADAKVKRVQAIADGTIPIAVRAAERAAHVEERRQLNIENIVASAVPELQRDVTSKQVDPDWVASFFEQCKDVSNEHMQQIWSKMLAAEVSKPDTFSRRTLSIVHSMNKTEAELFTKLCSLLFQFDNSNYSFVVPSYEIFELIREKVVNSRQELHLQNIGLLNSVPLWRGRGSRDDIPIKYFGKEYSLSIPKNKSSEQDVYNNNDYDIELFPLTAAGNELFAIAGGQPFNEFIELWKKDSFTPNKRVLIEPKRTTRARKSKPNKS